jgi:TetR/AcrR family transcriptional regulator
MMNHRPALIDASVNPLFLTPRKRPKPGERRLQILHTLATMLEQPGAERVTTASLATQLGVSEAALYRHFASKGQMFEALIDFIEKSLFGLINEVVESHSTPRSKIENILILVLKFGHENPGMTRVMVGDALVFENERLVMRMSQILIALRLS